MDIDLTLDLDLARIAEAAETIDPVFRDTPQYEDEQLAARLGRRVLVKVETANPLRSFKGRGADFLMRGLDARRHVVCASSGNFGQGMAYAGRARGIPVTVVVPGGVNPAKLARVAALGAEVIEAGPGFDAAKNAALEYAAAGPDRVYIVDGKEARVAEGAGTIGLELLRAGPYDAILVPVGDGALINGIGRWVKAHAPHTRIIGIVAAGATALAESWRRGEPVSIERVDTIADGLGVRVPVPESVRRMRTLVDDFVTVRDADLTDAMRLAQETLGLVLEPAGAAGLAALTVHDLPADRVATVLTGGNLRP